MANESAKIGGAHVEISADTQQAVAAIQAASGALNKAAEEAQIAAEQIDQSIEQQAAAVEAAAQSHHELDEILRKETQDAIRAEAAHAELKATMGAGYVDDAAKSTSKLGKEADRAAVSFRGLTKVMSTIGKAAGFVAGAAAAAFGIAKGIDYIGNRSEYTKKEIDGLNESLASFVDIVRKQLTAGSGTEAGKQIAGLFDSLTEAAKSASKKSEESLQNNVDVIKRQIGLGASRDEIVSEAMDAANRASAVAIAGARRIKQGEAKEKAEADRKAAIANQKKLEEDRQRSYTAQRQEAQQQHIANAELLEMQAELADERTKIELLTQARIERIKAQQEGPGSSRAETETYYKRLRLADLIGKKLLEAFDSGQRDNAAKQAEKLADDMERAASAATKFRDAIAQARIESIKLQDQQQSGFGIGDLRGSLEGIKRSLDQIRGQIR